MRVVTPLGNDLTMEVADPGIRAEAFDWHQRIELGNGVAVTLVPTRHWSARGLFDRNRSLWASFVLETAPGKSMPWAIWAMAKASIFAMSDGRTVRCGWRCCRLALMSRAGS